MSNSKPKLKTALRVGMLFSMGTTALALRRLLSRQRSAYPDPQSLILKLPVTVEVARATDGAFRLAWAGSRPLHSLAVGSSPEAARASLESGVQIAFITIDGGQVEVRLPAPPVRPCFALRFAPGDTPRIAAERVLPLEGGFNFRDLGGYQTGDGRITRWGQVFRAGQLGALTRHDQALLESLGIRLVCDLRTTPEIAENPDALPAALIPVRYPILNDHETAVSPRAVLFNLHKLDSLMRQSYTALMLDQRAPQFAAILRRMTGPGSLPAVFHCTAGKDRTGLTAALLLGALGVPDETIIADYAYTNTFHAAIRATMTPMEERLRLVRLKLDDLMPLLTAHPDNMRSALLHLRTHYGSVEGYLCSAGGLETEVIEQLRASLLE